MTREEEIKKASQEFAQSIASIRPELNADSFRRGAEWADSNQPKDTSLIKWQTGEPTEHGHYLITLRYCCGVNVSTGKKDYAEAVTKNTWNGFWYDFRDAEKYKVLAWCKLCDVEPYKE